MVGLICGFRWIQVRVLGVLGELGVLGAPGEPSGKRPVAILTCMSAHMSR